MVRREEIGVLICDDDELNLGINQKLVELIGKKHNTKLKTYAFKELSAEVIALIRNNHIDIAILDIELKRGNGIAIAKEISKINREISIIFVSSYKKYKYSAWDAMAIGFVEKPADTEKFELIFLRAISLAKAKLSKENSKFIKIVAEKKPIILRVDNIMYVEKVRRKVEFKTEKDVYSAFGTLKQYEDDLTSMFIKVSQSIMVNKHYIDSIDSYNVYLTSGDEFVIGRTYKEKVKKFAETLQDKEEHLNM